MPSLSSKIQKDKDKKLIKLGEAIRTTRKSKKLSQEDVAYISGIERGNMGKIERGENNVSILNLIRIAAALGTTASELLLTAKL